MILEYKNWPGKRTEMTKEDFNKLGKRKNLFIVIDEKESLSVKQQMISNQIGTGAKKSEAHAKTATTATRKPSTGNKKNES